MKQKFELINECLQKNVLTETNVSSDVGQFAPIILPLVQKIYPESLVAQIASIQPTTSPVARVSALYSMYSGNASNNDNNLHVDGSIVPGMTWSNSKIITVAASAASLITVGSSASSGSNVITVFYKETVSGGPIYTPESSANPYYTHVLVRVDSGNIVTNDTFTFGATPIKVLYASANRNIVKRIFSNYAGIQEIDSAVNQVNFEIRTATLTCKTKKIKSAFTREKVQDVQKLYGEETNNIVGRYIANEIQQEIDREIVEYLKDIATPMPVDIDLSKSFANASSGSIGDLTYDLYFTIFAAIEEIVKATKRNRTMFILADSATVALLTTNALHSDSTPEESNPYRVGSIGAYPLYCDPFSTEHYMIIGYRYESDAKDDAGLIFTPYVSTLVEATDPATFGQVYMTMNRYGYIRHPQDSGNGIGDSDFFRYVSVNFGDVSSIANQGANLVSQVRKTY